MNGDFHENQLPNGLMICPKCGKLNSTERTFCTDCGARLKDDAESEEIVLCKHCKALLEPGTRFCPTCGSRIEMNASPPPVDLPEAEKTTVITSKRKEDAKTDDSKSKKHSGKKPLIVLSAAVLVLLVTVIVLIVVLSNRPDKSVESNTSEAATAAPTNTASAPPKNAPQSKAEIVAYFNEAANKIKTDATKVVRNYEDLQHNEEYLVLPSALQAVGKPLISTFLKKDETPLDLSGQDITDNFPVKGQSYVSNAKENDIAEATCTDEGDSYRIKLKFIETTDPTDNGAATAFNLINPDEVYSNASMVKSYTCKYYDPVIECTVDKANKRVTWINYTLPIILNATAQVIVSLDTQVGMTFIDDYTVTY